MVGFSTDMQKFCKSGYCVMQDKETEGRTEGWKKLENLTGLSPEAKDKFQTNWTSLFILIMLVNAIIY